MKRLTALIVAAALSSCGGKGAPQDVQPQAMLMCAKDTDCKGERICDAGRCKNLVVSTVIGPGSKEGSGADDVPAPESVDPQAALVAALRLKPGTTERLGMPVDAVMGYVNGGYVSKKPDFREDYSDFRIIKKPIKFMGHDLVAIDEEYLTEYVGCCVSEGMAVTVRLNVNGQDLDAFADSNGCQVTRDTEEFYAGVPALPKEPKGTYATLSCKERDISVE